MKTMYIAANNALQRGYFLGDMLGLVKVAWLFVENEPHDHVVLSLHDRDPLNFLWNRFIADNCITVVHDRGETGSRVAHYDQLDQRRASGQVKGIAFDTYKELYPRLRGGARQRILCGREAGLGRKNIFEYYYFGQPSWVEQPRGTTSFGTGLIDLPGLARRTDRSVFLAPHEKCHGNRVFALEFWERVLTGLLRQGVHVTVNDDGQFAPQQQGRQLVRTFEPFERLIEQVACQRLVVSGNTGIGWVAGATGTPLIACESADMVLREYSFARCGVQSLVKTIAEPDATRTVDAIVQFVEDNR